MYLGNSVRKTEKIFTGSIRRKLGLQKYGIFSNFLASNYSNFRVFLLFVIIGKSCIYNLILYIVCLFSLEFFIEIVYVWKCNLFSLYFEFFMDTGYIWNGPFLEYGHYR